MKQTFTVLVLGLCFLGSQAFGQSNSQATIGLYIVPENDAPRNVCSEEARDCEDAELSVSGFTYESYVVYVCVFNADAIEGVAGLEFGIKYDGAEGSGVDIFSDLTCSDFAFNSPGWPKSGTDATFVWRPDSDCQQNEPGGAGTGVTAVAAAFTVFAYSPDQLRVVAKRSGEVNITNCNLASFDVDPERRGSIAFSEDGTEEGNPGCTRAIVEDATWGDVKKTYGN